MSENGDLPLRAHVLAFVPILPIVLLYHVAACLEAAARFVAWIAQGRAWTARLVRWSDQIEQSYLRRE